MMTIAFLVLIGLLPALMVALALSVPTRHRHHRAH
jgi:hypothetical protein